MSNEKDRDVRVFNFNGATVVAEVVDGGDNPDGWVVKNPRTVQLVPNEGGMAIHPQAWVIPELLADPSKGYTVFFKAGSYEDVTAQFNEEVITAYTGTEDRLAELLAAKEEPSVVVDPSAPTKPDADEEEGVILFPS